MLLSDPRCAYELATWGYILLAEPEGHGPVKMGVTDEDKSRELALLQYAVDMIAEKRGFSSGAALLEAGRNSYLRSLTKPRGLAGSEGVTSRDPR